MGYSAALYWALRGKEGILVLRLAVVALHRAVVRVARALRGSKGLTVLHHGLRAAIEYRGIL